MSNIKLANLLIDKIIEYKREIRFADAFSIQNIEEKFYIEMTSHYDEESKNFIEATLAILMNETKYLNDDSVQIKMECAGMWCNEPIYLEVVRLRFYMHIDSEEDIVCIQNLLKNIYAQTCPTNEPFSKKSDAENAFFLFFHRLSNSQRESDIHMHRVVSSISLPIDESCLDVSSIVAYISLQSILGKKVDVPAKYKNIYTVATYISQISVDGLQLWISNNSESAFKKLIRSLKSLNLLDLYTIMQEYYESILNSMHSYDANYHDFCQISLCFLKSDSNTFTELTSRYEKKLFDILNTNDFDRRLNMVLSVSPQKK